MTDVRSRSRSRLCSGMRETRERIGTAARERFEAKFTVGAWLNRLMPIYDLALAGAG